MSSMRLLFAPAVAVFALATVVAVGCQFALTGGGDAGGADGAAGLSLVSEFKGNILWDVSADGALALLHEARTPTRTYTIPLDGARAAAGPAGDYGDLRVIELAGGRELGRVALAAQPIAARFVPGTRDVFYSELAATKSGSLYKRWDYAANQVRTCPVADEEFFTPLTFLNPSTVLGSSPQKGKGDLLIEYDLQRCGRSVIGPVDPADPGVRTWGSSAPSPDQRFLALTSYGGRQIVVWDVAGRKTSKITPPSGLYFTGVAYAPGGKHLILTATTNPFAGTGTKKHLLIYDAHSHQLLRQTELPGADALAVSPDVRLVAVGYTKEKETTLSTYEQARVILYDLQTGVETARASHPPVKRQRGDPFAAKINRLMFSPDSKHLLSSTYDTRVWRIETR